MSIASEVRGRRIDELPGIGVLRQIGGDRQRLPAGRLGDLPGSRIEPFPAARAQGDIAALARQGQSDGLADPHAAAGDGGDLSVKPKIHARSPPLCSARSLPARPCVPTLARHDGDTTQDHPMPDGVIGRSVKRIEDPKLLRGQGCFVDDFRLPGMVWMAILRSPLAHARILALDLAAARSAPGVLDVFCAADLEAPVPEIPVRLAAMPEFARFLQPPLARDKVRFVGEPMAVAVAEDRYRAEDALALIAVEYEPLPVVAALREAAAARSPIHERAGENVAVRYRVSRGDADAAFAGAAYRRRETFRTHRQAPCPMETRGLVADFYPADAGLKLWGATKIAHYNRDVLARAFGLARDAVELIALDVGGGFGVRGELYPEDYLVPIASRRTGRPVKWIEDRREHLMATNQARDIECTLEIAADAHGRIRGLRGTLLADIGAYVRTNGAVAPTRTGQFLPGPYAIDNVALSVCMAVTNKTPTGTYRGPGRFEANFFRERMIDLMAGDLGIDPAEIRMRNLLRPDALPYAIGTLIPGEAGTAYAEGDYPAVFARLLSAIDYDTWPQRQGGTDRQGRRHGLGLACFVESSAAGPPENARILAHGDGGHRGARGLLRTRPGACNRHGADRRPWARHRHRLHNRSPRQPPACCPRAAAPITAAAP